MGKLEIKKGFTIIEVVMVLSISALLLVGLLSAWNENIKAQRYNDSVQTFKSDLQKVFAEVENPSNERKGNFKCDMFRVSSSNRTDDTLRLKPDGTGDNRGASNCVLLGKMIMFNDMKSGDPYGYGIYTNMYYQNNGFLTFDIIGYDLDPATACSGKPCRNAFEAIKALSPSLLTTKEWALNNYEFDKHGLLDGSIKFHQLAWGAEYVNVTNNMKDASGSRLFGGKATYDGTDKTYFWWEGHNGLRDLNAKRPNMIAIMKSPLDGSIMSFVGSSGSMYHDAVEVASVRFNDNYSFFQFFIDERFMLSANKTLDFCVQSNNGNWIENRRGKNRVIRIGSKSSEITIAPRDGGQGSGSMSCDEGRRPTLWKEGQKVRYI